jgi:phosphomethylpyrimidine synthase
LEYTKISKQDLLVQVYTILLGRLPLSENLIEAAIAGKEVTVINDVAKAEGMRPSFLLKQIALGHIAIMQREGRQPSGIGEGLKTKINANIGTSSEVIDIDNEVNKAKIAEKYGADTISDLSMGGPIDKIRRRILEGTTIPLTTVPIYQTVTETSSFRAITEHDIARTIRMQANEGISSIVIHAGFSLEMLGELKDRKRIMGMVSKGGSFTAAWMLENGRENPFKSRFDEICQVLAQENIVLSLGNAMRSGCIHDPMDEPQKEEIIKNAELARRANELGVQVIIEGMGGHVRPDRIPDYVAHYKRMIDHRPLFVSGPLPTEIGVGYDHISGCVGGALAAGAGADYLCYITPTEHLALPNIAQVREGVVAFKIAAHIGDTLKYGQKPEDKNLSEHRRTMNWEGQFKYAIDGERAREIQLQNKTKSCSMCGRYCAIKIMARYLM